MLFLPLEKINILIVVETATGPGLLCLWEGPKPVGWDVAAKAGDRGLIPGHCLPVAQLSACASDQQPILRLVSSEELGSHTHRAAMGKGTRPPV